MTKKEFELKRGHFRVSDFCITGEIPPDDVAQAIIEHHITPMNVVRHAINRPIFVSQKSGYRPKSYELKRKRSGTSQHTYEDANGKLTKGATDWTVRDNLMELLNAMCKYTSYTRLCWYPKDNFIHADYKPTASGKRELYTAESEVSKWKFMRHIEP